MKSTLILAFILLLMSFHSRAQQTIDKLNTNQLKLPKESVSKALLLDATGQVKSSSTVTDTELSYLDGLTDTLVNLLSGKANDSDVVKLSTNQSIDGIKTYTGKLVALSTTNGSIPCPGMTQTQRDGLTPANGECVYNSTSLKLNIYDGSVWKDVGGSGGISLWVTSNGYVVNDVVIQSDKIYICLIAHTSGTFATDLSSGYWNEISKVMTAKSKNTSSLTINELQIPNNQLVETSTNKYYVETGNKNILTNPSFEHSSVISGWTNSAGSAIANNTGSLIIDGNQSVTLSLSSQIMDFYQDSTLYNAEFNGSVQGIATVRINTTVDGLRVCSRTGGSIVASNCVNVINNGKWNLYKVPFILAFGSNGISINSNGVSKSGDINIDDSFVGASDLTQNINACNNVNCETEFSVNVSATGVVSGENLDWISSCTNATTPVCTFNTGIFTVAPNCWMSFTGGDFQGNISSSTTTVQGVRYSSAGVAQAGQRFYFCQKQGIDFTTAKQLSNGNIYSSNNSDTDWASCNLTGAAFTGFGSSVPTPSLQCKKQGADLLIKGNFTAGTTPTAVEARMALPVWNGVQLVSANSSIIPLVQVAGVATLNITSASYFGEYILIEPSVSYLTFGIQSTTTNAYAKGLGSNIAGSGSLHSINARIPIEGWQGSNIIVGSFKDVVTTPNTTKPVFYSTKISAAGIVSDEVGDFISGSCSCTSGNYSCTFRTNTWISTPNCGVPSPGTTADRSAYNVVESTSSVTFRTSNAANTGQCLAVELFCHGVAP